MSCASFRGDVKTITFDTLSFLPGILLGLALLSAALPRAATRILAVLAALVLVVLSGHAVVAVADAGSFSAQAAGGYIGGRLTDRLLGVRLELDPLSAPLFLGLSAAAAAALLGLGGSALASRPRGGLVSAIALTVLLVLQVLAVDLVVVAACFSLVSLFAALLPLTAVGARPAGDAAVRAFVTHRVGDAGLVLGLAALHASLGSLSPEALFVAPLDVDPWARLAEAGLFGGQPHRAVWFFAGVGVAVAVSSRLGLLCWPLVRDLTASPDLPAPLVGLTHVALVGSGAAVLVRLMPVLGLAPEAQDGLLWAAAVTACAAGVLAATGRDLLRLDAHLLAGAAAPMVVLACLGDAVGATLSAIVLMCLAVAMPWTLTSLASASRERDPVALSGLEHVYPRLHTSRLLATATAAALPPFAGWVVLERALEAGMLSPKVPAALLVTVAVGAVVVGAGAWRVVHLVFSGTRPAQEALNARGPAPPGWVPVLVVALIAPALALLELPPLLLRQLPFEIDYSGPLGTFMAPAVADQRAIVAMHLPAQVPPKLPPSTFVALVLGLGFLPYGLSALVWRARATVRPGPPPGAALRSTAIVTALSSRLARLAGRESTVARGVGDAVDHLSRIVAANLVPMALSLALQRVPGWATGLVGFALRALQTGGAQATIVLATVWLGWLYVLSK